MVLAKNRQIDQWNITDTPEIDPYEYNQLIFNKGTKAIQWSKDSILFLTPSRNDRRTTGNPYAKTKTKRHRS